MSSKSTDCSLPAYSAEFQRQMDQNREQSRRSFPLEPEMQVAQEAYNAGKAALSTAVEMSKRAEQREGERSCGPGGYAVVAIEAIDPEAKTVKMGVKKVTASVLSNLGFTTSAVGCAIGSAIGGLMGAGAASPSGPGALAAGAIGAAEGCVLGAEIAPGVEKGYKIISKLWGRSETAAAVKRELKEHSQKCGIDPSLRAPPSGGKPGLTPSECQTGLTQKRLHNHSLNSFAQPQPKFSQPSFPWTPQWQRGQSGPLEYNYLQPNFSPPISSSNDLLSFSERWRRNNAVQDAIRMECMMQRPNLLSAYMRACCTMGFGQAMSLSEFRSIAVSTALIGSYNAFNRFDKMRDADGLHGEIGGVGHDVSLITDLIDSEAHAEASEYILCFPEGAFPFSDALFWQMMRETADGVFMHHTFPFFSLHFHNNGTLYPVIHPAYRGTLTGEIISLLDYWMKGFLNGGIFDEKFLALWPETANCDEAFLRSKLVDLKRYCKENCQGMSYTSLREKMSSLGLKSGAEIGESAYKQPFMTSFRIIAFQEKIERQGNLLIPHPTFRVEYTIEPNPDYQQYLDAYRKEHGEYPPEYQKMRLCYELYAEEIKEKMPKMPFCRDFFRLLGAMNFFCYFYATLEEMGKRPVFAPLPPVRPGVTPKAYPPLPVRYHQHYPLKISMGDLLRHMRASLAAPSIDQLVTPFFAARRVEQIPGPLSKRMREEVAQLLGKELARQCGLSVALNEDEVERIAQIAEQRFSILSRRIGGTIDRLISRLVASLPASEKRAFMFLGIVPKMAAAKQALAAHYNRVKTRWEALPELEYQAASLEFAPELQRVVSRQWAGVGEELPALDQMRSQVTEQKNLQEAAIAAAQAGIQQIEKNKQDQVNSIPVHLRAINQANINNFVAAQNQRIAAIQADIVEMQSNLAHINAGLEAIGPALTLPQARKKEMLRLLGLIHDQQIKKLDELQAKLGKFTEMLLENEGIEKSSLTDRYTDSRISFTGEKLAQETGDRFRIHGGCGHAVPNLTSQPIADGEALYARAAQACPKKAETIHSFSFNERAYRLFRLPVEAARSSAPSSESDDALLYLEEACESSEMPNIPAGARTAPLDASGASFIHYAAALLNRQRLSQLLAIPGEKDRIDRFGNKPIHAAAYAGNAEAIEAIVAIDPAQKEAMTKSGATPLFLAVQYGQLAAVEKLLSLGVQANSRLPNGLFPLFVAIQNQHSAIAQLLLSRCANLALNETMDSGETALHVAINRGLSDVAETLIAKGANVSLRRKSDGCTAWHLASKKGALSLLKAMLAKGGVDVDAPLESGKRALHLAAEAGHADVVAYLLSIGASVDSKTVDGETPLMLAVKMGHVAAAKTLAGQAACNTTNAKGESSSLQALQQGMPSVADILFRRGENPELKDKQGYNAVYYLVRQDERDRLIFWGAQKKIDLQQRFDGESLSTIAARFGHFLLVYDLLDLGVKITGDQELVHYAVAADEDDFLCEWLDTHSPDGRLAFLAAKQGSHHCLERLLARMSQEEIKKQGLLCAALDSGDEATVRLVAQRLSAVDQPIDAEGNTPLHHAAMSGSSAMVELLLKLGHPPAARNGEKKTAFHLAIEREDSHLLKRLFQSTVPQDRPDDIFQAREKKACVKIEKLLRQYAPQSLLKPKPVEKKSAVQIALRDLEEMSDLLEIEDFTGAVELLKQRPLLCEGFKSGELFGTLLANISVYSAPTDPDEEISFSSSPDELLAYLSEKDACPVEGDLLENLLATEKEETALYRLDLFARHFGSRLPLLSQGLANLALRRDWRDFFERLSALCNATEKGRARKVLSPLHELVLADNFRSIEFLLNRDKDAVDLLNDKRQTPLMLAAAKDNAKILSFLLAKGAQPDLVDFEGRNALHCALLHKAESSALQLLPLLRRPNAPDRRGKTPLTIAAAQGMLPIVRSLSREAGVVHSVDKQGRNALHVAALTGQKEVVALLVRQGFPVDQPESRGLLKRTPLHLAALAGKASVVEELLSLGADPTQADARGRTLCEYAVLGKDPDTLNLVRQMPFYHDKARDTPLLHAAAIANHQEMASELILDFANLNGADKNGMTALHLAAINNAAEVAEMLLGSEGIALDLADREGNRPVHLAAQHGHVRILEALAAAGADMSSPNQNQQTPLDLAQEQGKLGAIAVLKRAV